VRSWLPALGLVLAAGASAPAGAAQEVSPEGASRYEELISRLESLGAKAAAHSSAREFGLAGLERELSGLYLRLLPSLVEVRCKIARADGVQEIATAGVVLTAEGLVVAPLFPLASGAEPPPLSVRRVDGARFSGSVLQRNEDYGLALIQVDGLRGMQPRLFPGEWIPEGAPVVAMGHAFGLEGSMSLGLVTGRARFAGNARRLLQITNPVNPGDGGGLLASVRGEVVAVLLTALPELAEAGVPIGVERLEPDPRFGAAVAPGGSALRADGIGFAVPIEIVASLFPEHLGGLLHRRRMLGVEVTSSLRVAETADGPERRWVVEVQTVIGGSAADAAGVQPGDLLLELDGFQLASVEDLGFAMFHAPQRARLLVLRAGAPTPLEVDFGAWRTPLPEFGLPPPRGESAPPAGDGD
jgi:serine protease Do